MKTYFIILPFVILFSSCIKVENASLCANAPSKPTIDHSTYAASIGGRVLASVVSPSASLTYQWINPQGTAYTGAALQHYNVSYSDIGTWSVLAQNGLACPSDTTKFIVNYQNGGCWLGLDTFAINGTAYSLTWNQSTTTYYGNYQMSFSSPYVSATVTFASKPTANALYSVVTNNGYSSIYNGQCAITFNGGYVYSGYTGTVNVAVIGSAIRITFCNVEFSGDYYTYGNAWLTGS